MGLGYIEKHLPTMLVEDFGIPMLPQGGGEQVLSYITPDWFPAKGSKHDDGRGGVLCFDDRNQAGADIQKVLANICQARTLHGVDLADGWVVVSTGNRQTDRAGANKVLSHLRNRETVLELETHLDDSTNWMINNGIVPEVVSFIRFRPELLHDFDPQRDMNPTPRSWAEGISPVLGNVPPEAEFECFKGAIGEGAAAEFAGYLKIWRNLPDPDKVIADPLKAMVPEDAATQYAISAAVAARAVPENFGNVLAYVDRLPKEFSTLTMTMAIRMNPELADTKELVDWSIKMNDLIF